MAVSAASFCIAEGLHGVDEKLAIGRDKPKESSAIELQIKELVFLAMRTPF